MGVPESSAMRHWRNMKEEAASLRDQRHIMEWSSAMEREHGENFISAGYDYALARMVARYRGESHIPKVKLAQNEHDAPGQ